MRTSNDGRWGMNKKFSTLELLARQLIQKFCKIYFCLTKFLSLVPLEQKLKEWLIDKIGFAEVFLQGAIWSNAGYLSTAMPSTARLYVPLLFLSNERKAAVSITVQDDGNRKCRNLSISHKTGISHVFVLIQSLRSNWYRNTLLKQFTHFHKWSADMGSTPTRFIVFLHLHFITFV